MTTLPAPLSSFSLPDLLRPCPWCGCKKEVFFKPAGPNVEDTGHVICNACCAEGPWATNGEAIKLWNEGPHRKARGKVLEAFQELQGVLVDAGHEDLFEALEDQDDTVCAALRALQEALSLMGGVTEGAGGGQGA
jgi:hypothetical protein